MPECAINFAPAMAMFVYDSNDDITYIVIAIPFVPVRY